MHKVSMSKSQFSDFMSNLAYLCSMTEHSASFDIYEQFRKIELGIEGDTDEYILNFVLTR